MAASDLVLMAIEPRSKGDWPKWDEGIPPCTPQRYTGPGHYRFYSCKTSGNLRANREIRLDHASKVPPGDRQAQRFSGGIRQAHHQSLMRAHHPKVSYPLNTRSPSCE